MSSSMNALSRIFELIFDDWTAQVALTTFISSPSLTDTEVLFKISGRAITILKATFMWAEFLKLFQQFICCCCCCCRFWNDTFTTAIERQSLAIEITVLPLKDQNGTWGLMDDCGCLPIFSIFVDCVSRSKQEINPCISFREAGNYTFSLYTSVSQSLVYGPWMIKFYCWCLEFHCYKCKILLFIAVSCQHRKSYYLLLKTRGTQATVR